MNMTTLSLLASVVLLYSGCATVRPQARVIDATNKQPIFTRSVEKANDKGNSKAVSKDGFFGKRDKEKSKSKSKTTTYDFTF